MQIARHIRRAVLILSAALMAQGAMLHFWTRQESVPEVRPLAEFPGQAEAWRVVQEGVVEKEVQDVLKADDLLSREYAKPGVFTRVNFFIAYFRSQRAGKAPHSPKNCLPGSGWVPTDSEVITVPVDQNETIEANLYVVSKGNYKSVVIYWYQSPGRTVASEYNAKIFLVLDSIRLNRSDTSMVRVVVPVIDNNVAEATKTGTDFVKAIFPQVRTYFPV